jgi:hypothetical protein
MFGLLGRFVWCWIVAGGGSMANIKISAWDVAEAVGLTYIGNVERQDKYGYYSYVYEFDFHGKVISKYEGCYDSEAEAKERVAEELLLEIGKKLSEMI